MVGLLGKDTVQFYGMDVFRAGKPRQSPKERLPALRMAKGRTRAPCRLCPSRLYFAHSVQKPMCAVSRVMKGSRMLFIGFGGPCAGWEVSIQGVEGGLPMSAHLRSKSGKGRMMSYA